MSNRLSFFISVFVVALVLSVSFVQLYTENPSRTSAVSLGAQAADFSSGISVYTFTPSDDVFIEGATVQDLPILKVSPGYQTVYLKFIISDISEPIARATLYLREVAGMGEGTITVSRGSHSRWTEDTLSLESAPVAVLKSGSLTRAFGSREERAVDIRGINGSGTYTFILTLEEGENDVWFSSGEGTPRLELVTGGDDLLSL